MLSSKDHRMQRLGYCEGFPFGGKRNGNAIGGEQENEQVKRTKH